MTIRVLILFSSTDIGGAERSLSRMAAGAQDVTYDVATLGSEGAFAEWRRSIGLATTCFGGDGSAGGRIRPSAMLSAVKYIRRTRPAIIYVIGIRAAIYMRLLKPLLRGALLVHGVRMNYTPDRPEFLPMRVGDRWLGGLTAGWIANSNAAAETLAVELGVPRERIAVIYNGIDLPEPGPPPSGRPPVVVTIANLARRKGHIPYLDAVRQILANVPEARFIFAGRDDMNGEVQAAIVAAGLQHAVTYLGYQSDTDALLREARVFVLPSFREGMPTAILEAMAHAIPTVAFPIDGIVDQIVDGATGRLPTMGDQVGLAKAVVAYLRDGELADRHGAAAQARISELFTFESTRSRHLAAWTNLLRRWPIDQDGPRASGGGLALPH